MKHNSTHRPRGFTMIELVIVMAMLGLLLSLALPQYMATLERGREQVLQSNLATMREAIDKFYGDRGRYPDKLEDLVTQRYLRAILFKPQRNAWRRRAIGRAADLKIEFSTRRKARTLFGESAQGGTQPRVG